MASIVCFCNKHYCLFQFCNDSSFYFKLFFIAEYNLFLDILQDALQSALKDAMQHINTCQQESLQVKRKDETPRRKVPPNVTYDKST